MSTFIYFSFFSTVPKEKKKIVCGSTQLPEERFAFFVLPVRVLCIENNRTFQKGSGVVSVAVYSIIDGVRLITLVTNKMEEKLALNHNRDITEREKPICGSGSVGH